MCSIDYPSSAYKPCSKEKPTGHHAGSSFSERLEVMGCPGEEDAHMGGGGGGGAWGDWSVCESGPIVSWFCLYASIAWFPGGWGQTVTLRENGGRGRGLCSDAHSSRNKLQREVGIDS